LVNLLVFDQLAGSASCESRSGVRFGGINAKRLTVSADFHSPLADDDLLSA
jgi:hypothetical protein